MPIHAKSFRYYFDRCLAINGWSQPMVANSRSITNSVPWSISRILRREDSKAIEKRDTPTTRSKSFTSIRTTSRESSRDGIFIGR